MRIDDDLLSRLTEQAKANPRKRMHFDLRDSAEDTSMRMLNAIEPDSVVPVHRHMMTSEDIICIKGEMDVALYDDDGVLTEKVKLIPGSSCQAVHIPAGVYHASESRMSGSVILEFKNTKYDPDTCEEMLVKA